MNVVAIIPARQWSVGTPAKNRKHFNATLACAVQFARRQHERLLATDDHVLMRMAHGLCTLVPRPISLEDGPLEAVIAHALNGRETPDIVVILQPSSPTQHRAIYVLTAIDLLTRNPEASAVVSVVPWTGEPPQKAVYVSEGKLTIPPAIRRQDCAPAYRRDGTVYAVRGVYAAQGDLYGPHPLPLLVTPADSVTVD